jgi:hypothetical protein
MGENNFIGATLEVGGPTVFVLGSGLTNTNAIIASLGNTGTYAARVCKTYAGGGYNDWYLPSTGEINKLYINRVAIGGFGNYGYWTSKEFSTTEAFGRDFITGNVNAANKTTGAFLGYPGTVSSQYATKVRPIRQF